MKSHSFGHDLLLWLDEGFGLGVDSINNALILIKFCKELYCNILMHISHNKTSQYEMGRNNTNSFFLTVGLRLKFKVYWLIFELLFRFLSHTEPKLRNFEISEEENESRHFKTEEAAICEKSLYCLL